MYLCTVGLVKEKIWITFFLPCSVQLSVCLGFGVFKEWWKLINCEIFLKTQQWIADCSCSRLVPYTLIATGTFYLLCFSFFNVRHVSCCWFRSTVSGPDGLLLTVQQMLMIFFVSCLFFSFFLCFLLVQLSGASCMESVQREVIYWKLWKLSTFHLLKISLRPSVLRTLALVCKLPWHLWWREMLA